MRVAVGILLLPPFVVGLFGGMIGVVIPPSEDSPSYAAVAAAVLVTGFVGMLVLVTSTNVNVRYLWILRREEDLLTLGSAEASPTRLVAEDVHALKLAEDLLITRRFARGAVKVTLVIAALTVVTAIVVGALGFVFTALVILVSTIVQSAVLLPFGLWTMAGVGTSLRAMPRSLS
ncbi:MAG: hypothetical protein ACFCVG_11200 [Kineosporiaceae bacterium]